MRLEPTTIVYLRRTTHCTCDGQVWVIPAGTRGMVNAFEEQKAMPFELEDLAPSEEEAVGCLLAR